MMWNEITADTRLIDLTVGQLKAILQEKDEEQCVQPIHEAEQPKNLEYGIAGLMRIYRCSRSTANKIKKSGKIDAAISQIGKTIVIDVDKALKLSSNE